MSTKRSRTTRRAKRPALTLCAALALCAVAVGCGDDDNGSNGGSNDTPAKVAFITNALTDFTQAQIEGMKPEVEPGGGSVTTLNPNFDPQAQIKQCQDAITSGRYNVIVLAPIDGASGIPCATAAQNANIPLISLDIAMGKDPNSITPTVDGVTAAATLSPKVNAERVLELATKACEGINPCEIIAEVVFPGDTYTQEALDAVTAEVPGAKIVQTIPTGFDPSVVVKEMPDALTAHPNADVFLAAADSSALAAVPALKSAGLTDKVKLIGNGGSRAGAKAVESGVMFGTTGNWPFQEGQTVGKWAVQAANGETIDPNGVDVLDLDTPKIVDKDTVSEFKAEWGAQG